MYNSAKITASEMDEDAANENPSSDVFILPSINSEILRSGSSYAYYSPVPPSLISEHGTSISTSDPTSKASLNPASPCILGIDEAGRGPVLGPMVYGVFYIPAPLSTPLLREEHRFDDSKVLTPAVRSSLMRTLCTPSSSLHDSCGWAVEVLSARDISAGMMKPGAAYNLNAQAMDATMRLIDGVYERGVNVAEIYVDTIGSPVTYQKLLAKRFPRAKVRVEKKADSLFAVVGAASVVAKVTRDVALEELYEQHKEMVARKGEKKNVPTAQKDGGGNGDGKTCQDDGEEESWGSGYPSDARCTAWLKKNMDPMFGWGHECRFSWATAKDMLETKGDNYIEVEWPTADNDTDSYRVTDYFVQKVEEKDHDVLGSYFGRPVGMDSF